MMQNIHFFGDKEINSLLSKRTGETKLGEDIVLGKTSIEASLSSFKGKYVVFGIIEDIGPQANGGREGARDGFHAFLEKWLNTQSNRFVNPKDVLLLGELDVFVEEDKIEKLRQFVDILDEEVERIIELIFSSGKIPIIIGGGHNNAYPIIKAYNKVFKKKLNVINLDPHADYRDLEGRHSGNSFSYAKKDGYMDRYGVIGLHKSYNSEMMLQRMEKDEVFFTFFDDYLRGKGSYINDTQDFLKSLGKSAFGMELDLDSIENMPSSAISPTGWSISEARKWLYTVKENTPVYYHFPEGAPKWIRNGNMIVGKTLSYFVNDVIGF